VKRFLVIMPMSVLLAAFFGTRESQQPVFSAGTGPCDIYASGGTPCVAAHSTVRALFGAYSGRLYQVRRSSNGGLLDIGTLSAGGYANAAAQDTFCSGTSCTITILYDQTSRHNDLTVEGAGGAGAADFPSVANALPISAGGHLAYGVYIASGNGYRDNTTSGVATGSQPEGMYMVASGTHVNRGCCFDYGNAETNTMDTGNGHMDAVNLGTTGPWVGADLENGIFGQPGTVPMTFNFVTATLKNNGTTTFAVKGGNANSGGLSTQYNGALPAGGYIPMHLEGAIVMGTGGDNSRWSVGSFFEGAMTAGYPSDATENAIQGNIVAAGYAGDSNGGAPGTIVGPGTLCIDVAGGDSGVNGAAVQLYDCQTFAVDQHWSYNLSDNSLRTLGRCLDIVGNGTANNTQLQLWDCNGVGGQKWVPQTNGSLRNPQSGRCVDSPGGAAANLTRLQIYDCNATAAQRFPLRNGTAGAGVIFYQDMNFGGGSSLPKAKGNYAALPADVPNDWMSSLRVPAGWTVQAYADGNFAGAVCTYTADTGWVGTGCNDNMSSFKIL
jgi:non-reducing end alpha-L-arabinofuranosidase